MRKSRNALLALVVFAVLPAVGRAQSAQPTIVRVQVGFKPVGESDPGQGAFKPFFWTPVWVWLLGGAEPARGEVVLEAEDADGVATVTRYPVVLGKYAATKVLGYVKTSLGTQRGTPIGVSLRIGDTVVRPTGPLPALGLPTNKRLCVTIGEGIPALEQVIALARAEKDAHPDQALREFQSWHLSAIESIQDMPDRWYGYDAADVVIVRTHGAYFDEFGALADWVRRGGRLIMLVREKKAEHAPPFPFVNGDPVRIVSLGESVDHSIQEWGLAPLFSGPLTASRVPLHAVTEAVDERADAWVRYAPTKSADPIPLVTRTPYGFGSVTHVGLPLDQIPPAAKNAPRTEAATFFRMLLSRVAGMASRMEGETDAKERPLAVQLSDQLDRFDVQNLSFGWVAVLIVLFIAVVGPLEYFVLRKLQSPALTWMVYPAAILGMCLFGYLVAPRYKGTELRINQIDVVDVDLLRSFEFQELWAPPMLRSDAHALEELTYLHTGRSYFTVMTPSAQNLTVGMEKRLEFLMPRLQRLDSEATPRKGARARSHERPDIVSWFGRADADYRVTAAGLFRQPYTVAADGESLSDVNMSVWGTKNFSAQWHAIMGRPLEHALTYPGRKAEESRVRVRGTLTNRLPVDLCDVWVLYDKVAFPVPEGLPSGQKISLSLGLGQGTQGIAAWTELPDAEADSVVIGERPETTAIFKSLMFHELRQTRGESASLFRPLDWSWRIRPAAASTSGVPREAIVIARAKSVRGSIEEIYARKQTPTRVWLGGVPAAGNSAADRPPLEGQLTQATYYRFLVPVVSEDK